MNVHGDQPGLNPDDPRPPSQQIANHIKAAILTRKLTPGSKLPSQHELANRYGVARETIKSALRVLTAERLIVTRQGSGAYVRARTERPVGLLPQVEAAFEEPRVTIDFAGFSGETLHGLIQGSLDKIRAGHIAPGYIAIRVLLPDLAVPSAIPVSADGNDDPRLRRRAQRIARRHTEAITDSLEELRELGLVAHASAEVRVHKAATMFKLYVINGQDAFFGFYPVTKNQVTIDGERIEMYDVLGKDVPLFHFAVTGDDTSDSTQYVELARAWFDSVWTTISHDYRP